MRKIFILLVAALWAEHCLAQTTPMLTNLPSTVMLTNLPPTTMLPPVGDITSGLVSYWPFTNNSYADVVGVNNGTTATGTASAVGPNGNANGAINFVGGTTSYVTCGNDSSTKITGDITITYWIYPNFSAGNSYSVMWRVVPVSASSYWPSTYSQIYVFNSGIFRWERGNNISANYDSVTRTPLPSNSTWQFVCTTSSGLVNTIYYNGAQVSQKTFTGTTPYVDNSTGLNIGGDPTVTSRLNGRLAGVRLYNRALSAAEVQQLYLIGVNRKIF